MSFIPHTPDDCAAMLKCIGIHETDELFSEIPKNLSKPALLAIPQALNEMELLQHVQAIAQQSPHLHCYIGAGCYEHHIPAAIWDIATRGEFLTSYTPYQAEVSQGTLQVLYEFQSMIAEIMGLEVANASLYDGATALAEAVLMAKRLQKNSGKNKVLAPATLHPHYQETLRTILHQQEITIEFIAMNHEQGITDISQLPLTADYFAIIILQTNFFGHIEQFDELTIWSKRQQMFSIACVNPLLQSVLKPPGEWGGIGVDIACGEGQPLGIPMASGGPLLGLLACKKEHVRQMPGRLVGKTIDSAQQDGFTLTLQAREQHIRRGKATSNICTNVGLNATAATIFMSLMGKNGLRRIAENSFHNTHALIAKLTSIPGVELAFSSHFFHETVVRFPASTASLLRHLETKQILGGIELQHYFPEFNNGLLIAVTETKSALDLDNFAQIVENYLRSSTEC